MKLTTRKIKKKATNDRELFYLIENDGTPVGFLTKYPNTRTEDHPWKLFLYDAPFVEAEPCPPVTMVTVSYGKSFRDSHAELLAIASARLSGPR